MKKKLYSFLGLLIGIAGIFIAGLIKEPLGNAYIYTVVFFLAVIVFCAVELYFRLKKSKTEDKAEEEPKILPEYRRKSTIMSKTEMGLYETLKELFSEKYEILPQVALVSVVDKLTQTSYRSELFRIADFCIADKETYAPLLLIELNDSSHFRADRSERDKKVKEICERAKLPLISFSIAQIKDAPEIRRAVLKNILRK